MYVTHKQFSFFVVFIISILAYWAILRSPLLYFDDAARIYTYLSIDQGVHGRPLADVVYLFLTGGLFVDFSPLSQVFSIACMVAAAFFLYDCLFAKNNKNEKYINIERCIFVLVFSVFPLNFAIMSYRFDSVSFGLATLLASLAFIKATQVKILCLKDVRFLFIPGIMLASSLALYQVMFGIYTCCAVLCLCNMLLSNVEFRIIIKRLCIIFSVCVVSVLCYLPVVFYSKYMLQFDHYGLGPHPYAKLHRDLPGILEFPQTILKNIYKVFSTLYSYIDFNVLSAIIFIAIFVFIGVVLTRKVDFYRKILALIALPCALVMCYGLQIFLVNPVLDARTFVAVAIFVACLFGIILRFLQKVFLKKLFIAIFSVFILLSSVVLSSIGNAQRDQYKFENQMVYNGLESDLMHLYVNNGLRSFYLTPGEPPICTTLQVLKQKYGFLKASGVMSFSVFFIQIITSYLPINYYLPSYVLPPPDPSTLETVIDKYNYSIKKVEPGRFVVFLKDITVPPFTPERWK